MAGGAVRKKPIGELRHRCRIEARVSPAPRDEFGAEIESWTAGEPVWCRVTPRPTDTREERRGSSQQADCTHVVVMRLRDGLTAKHRLVWLRAGGVEVTLNVVAVGPMEGAENWLEVWCKSEQ
jgi:head-tail adaptor